MCELRAFIDVREGERRKAEEKWQEDLPKRMADDAKESTDALQVLGVQLEQLHDIVQSTSKRSEDQSKDYTEKIDAVSTAAAACLPKLEGLGDSLGLTLATLADRCQVLGRRAERQEEVLRSVPMAVDKLRRDRLREDDNLSRTLIEVLRGVEALHQKMEEEPRVRDGVVSVGVQTEEGGGEPRDHGRAAEELLPWDCSALTPIPVEKANSSHKKRKRSLDEGSSAAPSRILPGQQRLLGHLRGNEDIEEDGEVTRLPEDFYVSRPRVLRHRRMLLGHHESSSDNDDFQF